MKNERLLKELTNIDDAFIEEADRENIEKVKAKVKRRKLLIGRSIAACVAVLVTVVNLWLFMPYEYMPVTSLEYITYEYYDVIKYLNPKTFVPTQRYRNNFEFYFNISGRKSEAVMGALPSIGQSGTDKHLYIETTDNQEATVIEGNAIKRSDKYVYYTSYVGGGLLSNRTYYLYLYEINGEDTTFAGRYELPFNDEDIDVEIYLSQDCKTITAIGGNHGRPTYLTKVVSLDVSDPSAITLKSEIIIKGECVSSRLTNGNFLVTTSFKVGTNPNFDQNVDYLPCYDEGDGVKFISPKDIVISENGSDTTFVSHYVLDEVSLEVKDSVAVLSASDGMYVSEKNIYSVENFKKKDKAMSEITGFSYSEDNIEYNGSIVLAGDVLNQYCMDEQDGMLRVFTSSREKLSQTNSRVNSNFYCISLEKWKIVSQIKNFAPDGENINSVKFTENKVYVCTSTKESLSEDNLREPEYTVNICDPIFIFDLSDVKNISVKRSEDMDGFSSSLVDMGEGKFVGIGRDSDGNLKLDMYREAEEFVETENSEIFLNVDYLEDYKAYYIDREKNIIGFPYQMKTGADTVCGYKFYQYTGSGFEEMYTVENIPRNGYETARGLYIDDIFYVFRSEACIIAKGDKITRIWAE